MQNFGKIKNIFNNILIEGIVKKDDNSKKLFKRYIKTIKESEILKNQFLIYNNIENRIDSDFSSANIFVYENLRLLDKYNHSDILNENKKLVNLIGEDKLNIEIEDKDLNKLYESLSNIIFTKRTAKNIDKITEEIKNVSKYITSNKPKEVNETVDLPISMLTNIMVEKYNEKYSMLDESEKELLKVLTDSNFEDKKNLYVKYIDECIDLVDNRLSESDIESKEKLLKVKNKLIDDKKELAEQDFLNKVSKLIELKNNLV
jgi:hypothetical protein